MPLSLVEREAPLPDVQPGSILLLAIPARSSGIVFKVKAFDPTLHPRGYKGLFIDTQDKIGAGDAKVGDVIATKSGKIFKVEGHGAKGIKVTSVDPDSGEILQKGTIVANGIEVARIEGGKGLGTKHEISTLDPGTYIQHPKSGKRFVVHKHGNWTTVHPVDAHGAVTGKHTVLPPHTEVLVAAKETSGHVTPQTVARVQQHAKPPTTTLDPKNTLGLKVGDKVKRKSSGEIFEVLHIAIDGTPYGKDDKGKMFEIQDLYYDRHVPEQLPPNLARPPSSYASGVGKNTAVVIVEIPEIDYSGRLGKKSSYQLRRVPDSNKPNDPGELLGSYAGVGAARKAARSIGENHEAVIETRNGARDYVPQVDDWVIRDGALRQIQTIVPASGGYYAGNRYTFHDDPGSSYYMYTPIPVPDVEALRKYARDHHGAVLPGGIVLYTRYGAQAIPGGKEMIEEALRQGVVAPKTVRAARPNLYLAALRHDFDPSELVGKTKGEALATLRKLGYGEITPREPNKTKLVNGRGARLHVHNKGGVVTSIDAVQAQRVIGGSGAAGFHAQLSTVLASGGDVRTLDPRDTGKPEEGTAITKTLLYDMALGKQNGVEKIFQGASGAIKVKADAAYRTEILGDPSFPKKASFVNDVEDPGLNIPIRQDVMDKHFPGWQNQLGVTWTGNNLHIKDPTEEESVAVAAIASGERNGIAEHVAKTYGTDFRTAAVKFGEDWASYQADPANPNGAFMQLSQGQRDYLVSTLLDVAPRAQRQWQLRQTEKERRLESVYEQKITEETSKRRKAEGTVAHAPGTSDTFELPLWDEISLEEQDLGDVESMVQNASKTTQVPMFFTGGILKDGFATALRRSGKVVIEAKIPKEFDAEAMQRIGGRQTQNDRVPNPHGNPLNRIDMGVMFVLDDGGGKKIEYVPHGGRSVRQTTPANQRGRLTFHGYTPEEAAARMEDLGITHGTETHVPYTSILRSRRRHGMVLPLHPDYVSGEAPLPKIPAAIGHGMESHNMEAVFDSGSLLPIAERHKLGIPITGTIPRQDISAGVDHLVFAAISPNASGYGDMTVIYKDSAYLRRDIIVVDRNFVNSGGADGRYPAYRNYHNKFRKKVGITGAAADVGAYEVLEPKARQAHINDRVAHSGVSGLGANQNEWDLAGGVPIEDMAVVVVASQSQATQLDRKLNNMLATGRISERPEVVINTGGRYSRTPIAQAQRPGFSASGI